MSLSFYRQFIFILEKDILVQSPHSSMSFIIALISRKGKSLKTNLGKSSSKVLENASLLLLAQITVYISLKTRNTFVFLFRKVLPISYSPTFKTCVGIFPICRRSLN